MTIKEHRKDFILSKKLLFSGYGHNSLNGPMSRKEWLDNASNLGAEFVSWKDGWDNKIHKDIILEGVCCRPINRTEEIYFKGLTK